MHAWESKGTAAAPPVKPANAPLPQESCLVEGYAFIENIHAATATSSTKCPARSNSARRASCTASATASLVIFPSPQR